MSKIIVYGDIHGSWRDMYADAKASGADAVLQVGDSGCWISEENRDKGARKHNDPWQFKEYYEKGEVPIPTYFCHGNHEDYDILDELRKWPKIKNLHYLGHNNFAEVLGLRVAGFGGIWAQKSFRKNEAWDKRQGKRKHFTENELDAFIRACSNYYPDIILTHDAPYTKGFEQATIRFSHHAATEGNNILEVILDLEPKYVFHGHYHMYYEANYKNTEVRGLGAFPERWNHQYKFEIII